MKGKESAGVKNSEGRARYRTGFFFTNPIVVGCHLLDKFDQKTPVFAVTCSSLGNTFLLCRCTNTLSAENFRFPLGGHQTSQPTVAQKLLFCKSSIEKAGNYGESLTSFKKISKIRFSCAQCQFSARKNQIQPSCSPARGESYR